MHLHMSFLICTFAKNLRIKHEYPRRYSYGAQD